MGRSCHEESMASYREWGVRRGIAICLGNHGITACMQGDYALARSLQEESLTIRWELGDEPGIAFSLEAFAALAIHEGADERFARLCGSACALRASLGIPLSPNE